MKLISETKKNSDGVHCPLPLDFAFKPNIALNRINYFCIISLT